MATKTDYQATATGSTAGATTLWEEWGGNASRNHIMFGDISAWFYQTLAGINPDPETVGFKHIIIKPQLLGDVKWARSTMNPCTAQSGVPGRSVTASST